MRTPFSNPSAVSGAMVIGEDRACARCGYNLRGLKPGDRCPECGTPIRIRRDAGGGMTEAPLSYLDRLALWSTVAIIGAGVCVASLLATIGASLGNPLLLAALGLAALGAGAWGAGVYHVTGPREFGAPSPIDPVREWARLRLIARVSQFMWGGGFTILFAGVTVLHGVAVRQAAAAAAAAAGGGAGAPVIAPGPPVSATVLVALGLLVLVLALVGMIAALLYFAQLADWANDLSLATRLRAVPFVVVASVPVGVLFLFTLALVRGTARMIIIGPAVVITGGLFLACVGFIVVPLIQFMLLCQWARANSTRAMDRDRRSSAAIVRRIEGGQARDAPQPAPVAGHRPARPQGNYIAPGSGGEAYDLAPEPDDRA
ncbi:MAG: hypothetical protein SFY69_03005 [Planctomycetota bacterium]|nr:hypothetical protein [Planctomycetota bacterium]